MPPLLPLIVSYLNLASITNIKLTSIASKYTIHRIPAQHSNLNLNKHGRGEAALDGCGEGESISPSYNNIC